MRIAAFSARVGAVKQQISEAISIAGFRRDPYRHVIEANAAVIDLYPDLIELMDATRQPFRPEDLHRLETAAATGASLEAAKQAQALARAANRRSVVIYASSLVAVLIIGMGLGYRFHADAPVFAGVRAGADKCEDRQDGSRLCWIPVYERLPPQGKQ